MSNEGFVPTRASSNRKVPTDFHVVSFETHRTKKMKQEEYTDKKPRIVNIKNEFNIKQAKQEVMKFTINGSSNVSEAKMQLAIKLGAKPPKNKYKNYKLLQTERKQLKEQEVQKTSFQQLGKNSIGKSNAKGKSFDRKRRKEKGDILSIYGKVKVASKQ